MNKKFDPAAPLLRQLEEEIEWLDELESLSNAACDAAVPRGGIDLPPILEKKTKIADALAARQEERAEMLRRGGHGDDDFLIYLLGRVEKHQQPEVVDLVGRYADAKERAARAVTEARLFFELAFDVVVDMRRAFEPPTDAEPTYDRSGLAEPAPVIPLTLSTRI